MKILFLLPFSKKENSFIFSKRECQLLRDNFHEDVDIHFLKFASMLELPRMLFELRKKIVNGQYDIIHAQYGTMTSFLGALVSFRKKFVITFRGADINGDGDVHPLRMKVALLLSWFAMQFADGVIYVSSALKERSPHLCANWKVIPTGVDPLNFHPLDQLQCKMELGLREELKYVLFYSSFNSANKRPDLATGAIEELNRQGRHDIELLILDGGISPVKMPIYLNAANVVLMVSDKEGSPTIIQEAIACGTAIVTVEVGDVKYVINGVENSTLVERTPESIALGILNVLNLPKRRSGAARDFELQTCVSRINALYNKILNT